MTERVLLAATVGLGAAAYAGYRSAAASAEKRAAEEATAKAEREQLERYKRNREHTDSMSNKQQQQYGQVVGTIMDARKKALMDLLEGIKAAAERASFDQHPCRRLPLVSSENSPTQVPALPSLLRGRPG